MLTDRVKLIAQLIKGRPKRGSQRESLSAFYAPQAKGYDKLRDRLLHGRRSMLDGLNIKPGSTLCELGCGTGRNMDFIDREVLDSLERVELVDLCPPLLEIAKQRYAGAPNIHIIEADATSYRPQTPLDRIYCSYSLTMIPNWRDAIDNALQALKPGGLIGVVDFFVSPPRARPGRVHHSRIARSFWRTSFRHDGVWLDADRLDYLESKFETVRLQESSGPFPWFPLLKVPHFVFIGRKRAEDQ